MGGTDTTAGEPGLRAAVPLPADAVRLDVLAAPPAAASEGETVLVQGSGATPRLRYYALDALGSVRVTFDATGAVIGRADYEPFGAAVTASTTGTQPRQQFTGHERDGEVGLDYFGARLYLPVHGRLPSVDPLYTGAVEDPQRWNRYAYARGNPLTYVDPDGRTITCAEWAGIVRCSDSTTTSKAGNNTGNGGGSWGGGGASGGGDGTRSASATDCMARTCSGGSGGGRAVSASDVVHAALDVAGVALPGVGDAADLVNAALYLAQGDIENAGIAAAGAVPYIGVGATISKWSNRADEARDLLLLQKKLASQEQIGQTGKILAGVGSDTVFRDAGRVAAEYGGNPGDWVKKTSGSYTAPDGRRFETHWVENVQTGQRVEHKTKIVK